MCVRGSDGAGTIWFSDVHSPVTVVSGLFRVSGLVSRLRKGLVPEEPN